MARATPFVELDDLASLEALWRERGADVSAFDERFLSEVPAAELRATLERTADALGAFESVRPGSVEDVLIDVLGGEAIEALSPFEPLLTCAEADKLRSDPVLEKRYSAAATAERRTILGSLADVPLAQVPSLPPGPPPGAGWYASAEALCDIVDRVREEPSTHGPKGFVDRANRGQVTEKGGSETGVLDLTVRLAAHDGTIRHFAVTWNGVRDEDGRPRPLDASELDSRIAGVVAKLAAES